jgi:hypothetical protein
MDHVSGALEKSCDGDVIRFTPPYVDEGLVNTDLFTLSA